MSDCQMKESIGSHNEAISTLKGQVSDLFIKSERRKDEISDIEKRIQKERSDRNLDVEKMVHSIEELSVKIDNVAGRIDEVMPEILSISKRVGDIEVKIDANKPRDPEEFSTVKISKWVGSRRGGLVIIFTCMAITSVTLYVSGAGQFIGPIVANILGVK